MNQRLRIAILLPCYNEGATIAQTVAGFRAAIPHAHIYVYDNNSSDNTLAAAAAAGAITRREPAQGKGNVVRRMFADIEADIYLMSDGDLTYPADAAPQLIERLVEENLDMVVGGRQATEDAAYRAGHRFGNRLFNAIVSWLFGVGLTDIFSGYRAFSHRFVKSFPTTSRGFEIETEMSIHALSLRIPFAEIMLPYFARPEGSVSKLRTYHDGFRILMKIFWLLKETRPLFFFGLAGVALMALSLLLAAPVITEFLQTGLVPRLPTAILATGIMLVGILSTACGMILESVGNARLEAKRLRYLSLQSLNHP